MVDVKVPADLQNKPVPEPTKTEMSPAEQLAQRNAQAPPQPQPVQPTSSIQPAPQPSVQPAEPMKPAQTMRAGAEPLAGDDNPGFVQQNEPRPLILVCMEVNREDRTVKIIEGVNEKGEDAINEVVRTVYIASFVAVSIDPKTPPNSRLVIESIETLPFDPGRKYELDLSEVEE